MSNWKPGSYSRKEPPIKATKLTQTNKDSVILWLKASGLNVEPFVTGIMATDAKGKTYSVNWSDFIVLQGEEIEVMDAETFVEKYNRIVERHP